MKKIKLLQKSFIMLVLAAFILPSSFSAHASELTPPLQQVTQTEVSPLWVYDYVETIQVTYNTPGAIPSEYHYEYYHNVYGWMRGVLKHKSQKYSNGKYIVTFSGRMYSNPL